MSFYFAFMHSQPDLARNLLQIGVVMGVLMGMVQVMRGAHFLSHVLWSGWLVWAVLLMLYWIWPPYQNASATTI
jgi:membrane-associated PAP2 superfamily phosphatase